MAFTIHPRPDHVHIETSCADHASIDCMDDHWKGGRPDPLGVHHVEVDCSTGLVGYTRLNAEEINERERLGAEQYARQIAGEAKQTADLAILRAEALSNPVFAALLRQLGVNNGT